MRAEEYDPLDSLMALILRIPPSLLTLFVLEV